MRRLIMNGNAKTLLLIISLAFNLGACLAVAVQEHGEEEPRSGRGEGRGHRERLSSKLNLSPEQTEIVSAAREQLFDELRLLKRRLHDESEVLADLLTASEVDMDTVSDQVEKVATVRNEIQWRMVQHLLSIREVLEPEQLESFKEFASRVLSRSGRGRPHEGKPPKHGPAPPTP
jgi:Spy/CpxP family protein refolding chaperone